MSGNVVAEDTQVVEAAPLVSVSSAEDRHLDPEAAADRTATAAPGTIGESRAVALAKNLDAAGHWQMLYSGAEIGRDSVIHDGIQRVLDAALVSVERS